MLNLFVSFNPRTHEGCDHVKSEVEAKSNVSIHAPTRGATVKAAVFKGAVRVSIHAPTRGATLRSAIALQKYKVSIHAPTRGATFLLVFVSSFLLFQSTHPRGVRRTLERERALPSLFQSTHPRGVRHKVIITYIVTVSFNPRTHEGCDFVE